MATKNIVKLLEKGNVAKDLKVAYSFLLLSRGYSADEIKVLDDYVFSIRKKGIWRICRNKSNRRIYYKKKEAKEFAKEPGLSNFNECGLQE